MANVSAERVQKAYAALGTLDDKIMDEYWDKDMVWLVPGHNPVSGWYHGRTAFINFMKRVGELSDEQLPNAGHHHHHQRRVLDRRDQ